MKFIISGYYGFDNLGDEVILAVLIQELHREFPEAELVVLSQSPEETTRHYHVKAINRWSLRQILRELSSADLFIGGGGGLIQDRSSLRSPFYYLGLMRLAMKFCPVVVIGQGIGPLQSPFIEWTAKRVFRRVGFAMLRDEASRNWVRQTGLPDEKIFAGADLIMRTWPAWASLREPLKPVLPGTPPFIGVTLSGSLSRPSMRALASELDRAYAEMGLSPVLISFHLHKDLKELEELQNLIKAPVLIVEPSASDLRGVLDCIQQMRFMVGMRLHSLIFSLLAARPFVGIPGDPKVERFVQQVNRAGGLEVRCWSFDEIGSRKINLVDQLRQIESCYEAERAALECAGEALYCETSKAMTQSWNAIRALLSKQTQ
ncbi:polysaccharide pyruvyl transferase CsaB [Candidatus Acetothermia bacterium]|nr:polysaccharide pyruvyl transferase CsaB [Candidatus Acetothermia bacterium]MBI3642526.1 polysaccharide pyruvyl transferase CsaB [Candidatus Acetothermia bacterium]